MNELYQLTHIKYPQDKSIRTHLNLIIPQLFLDLGMVEKVRRWERKQFLGHPKTTFK